MLSLSRDCRTVQSAYKPPPGHVASKKCEQSAISGKSPFLRAGLPVFPRARRLGYKISPRENIALRPELTSTSDKRDDMSADALRISDCPVCHPASVVPWPRGPGLSGRVAFPKVVKTAQSSGRTERTLPRRSPQARPRGPRPCCGQAVSADVFRWFGGICTGRAHRCKAKQGRHGKTAPTSGSYPYISTVFGARPEGVFSNAR